MLTRLRAVRATDERGFTLAELLVGASLAGVAGTIATVMFVAVSTQASETSTREQLGAESRVALNQIAAELQYADSPTAIPITADGRFETFSADKVTFYSNRDKNTRSGSLSRTPPSKVTIERVADTDRTGAYKLIMSVYRPTNTYGVTGKPYPSSYVYANNYPTVATQTMTLANGIGNDTSKSNEAIFTYCSAAPDPAPTATPAPTAAPAPQCDSIVPTGTASKDKALANQISSVIVRLKVGGGQYRNTNTKYQPATWLTTRVAVSGKVDDPAGAS